MDTKRLLLSAAAAIALCACDKWESPPDDPGVALARAQILAAPALQVHGATLNVPSTKYPTIGAALSSAKRGDLVRVAPGYYPECIVLVDGVTVEGMPGAMLDGSSCDLSVPAIVYADASVQQGATVRGFHITGTKSPAVHLEGARAVEMLDLFINTPPGTPPRTIFMNASTRNVVSRCQLVGGGGIRLFSGSSATLSDLDIQYGPGPGVRSSESSFTLQDSRLLGNAGPASVFILHGSRATLSNNDIEGFTNGVRVDSGIAVDEVGWAPSQARLEGNRIHGNGEVGLWVAGRGSRVIGSGNTYEASGLSGVHVTGGATYVGERERMTGNTWDGLVVRGCDQRNRGNADGSFSPVILQERSLAVLNDFALDGNGADGLWAACDAQVNLAHGSISHNVGRGAGVASTWDFGDGNQSYAPSRLGAVWTVFGSNRVGALLLEDSRMILGTLEEPGMNSFLDNWQKAIGNRSSVPVFAQWNWFGTTDAAVIAGSFVGDVTYDPFLLHEP